MELGEGGDHSGTKAAGQEVWHAGRHLAQVGPGWSREPGTRPEEGDLDIGGEEHEAEESRQ